MGIGAGLRAGRHGVPRRRCGGRAGARTPGAEGGLRGRGAVTPQLGRMRGREGEGGAGRAGGGSKGGAGRAAPRLRVREPRSAAPGLGPRTGPRWSEPTAACLPATRSERRGAWERGARRGPAAGGAPRGGGAGAGSAAAGRGARSDGGGASAAAARLPLAGAAPRAAAALGRRRAERPPEPPDRYGERRRERGAAVGDGGGRAPRPGLLLFPIL